MREERVVIDGVPTKLYVPPSADALLLMGHGGGHSKDGPRFVHLARRYAEQVGLAVVCIDAIDHGERRQPNASSELPREWHSSTIGSMVQDWQETADALASIGPAVAYVGFSMGAIFGVPTVAAMPSLTRAVFVAGGLPDGSWVDDRPLRTELEAAATRLEHADVLMLNMADDELFPSAGARSLFDATRARSKSQVFWEGHHDAWPDDLIVASIEFLAGGEPA